MKQILTFGAAAAAASSIAIAVAVTGGAEATGERTITLFQDVAQESSALIDNAPKSPTKNPESRRFRLSMGDELVARTPVLDRAGGGRRGTLYGHAVVVRGKRFEKATFEVQAVLALGDGTITLAGLAGDATNRPIAVTGGTGAYDGARGTATEKETGSGAELAIRLVP